MKISRIHFPDQVVQLEEQWADWLFSQANYDVAVPHFLGEFLGGSFLKLFKK